MVRLLAIPACGGVRRSPNFHVQSRLISTEYPRRSRGVSPRPVSMEYASQPRRRREPFADHPRGERAPLEHVASGRDFRHADPVDDLEVRQERPAVGVARAFATASYGGVVEGRAERDGVRVDAFRALLADRRERRPLALPETRGDGVLPPGASGRRRAEPRLPAPGRGVVIEVRRFVAVPPQRRVADEREWRLPKDFFRERACRGREPVPEARGGLRGISTSLSPPLTGYEKVTAGRGQLPQTIEVAAAGPPYFLRDTSARRTYA